MTFTEIIVGSGVGLWLFDTISTKISKYKNYNKYFKMFKTDISTINLSIFNVINDIDETILALTNNKSIKNSYMIESDHTFYENFNSYLKLRELFDFKEFNNIIFYVRNSTKIFSEFEDFLKTNKNSTNKNLINDLTLYKFSLTAIQNNLLQNSISIDAIKYNTIKIYFIKTLFLSEI